MSQTPDGIRVHETSEIPIYKQIENRILCAIASGRLVPQDRLPTMRELGKTLGLERNTVAVAYRNLQILGFVYTRRKLGTFIATGAQAKAPKRIRSIHLARLAKVTSEAREAGFTRTEVKDAVTAALQAAGLPGVKAPASTARQSLSLR